MSHDLISDSIFHLNNANAALQAHMTDTFGGSLGRHWKPFLNAFVRVTVFRLGVF